MADTLARRNGVLHLPLIENAKTVDPADGSSPEVVQIESAMGSAVEVFAGATAICVGRDRFLPVKTTCDLLLLRSDVYQVDDNGRLIRSTDQAPLIDLDSRYYKAIGAFEQRFPDGAPSLREATRLVVRGDWTFEGGVRVVGDAVLDDLGEPRAVPGGTVIEDEGAEL